MPDRQRPRIEPFPALGGRSHRVYTDKLSGTSTREQRGLDSRHFSTMPGREMQSLSSVSTDSDAMLRRS